MKSELEKKLNKQIHLHVWIFGLGFMYTIGYIMFKHNDSDVVKLVGSLMFLVTVIPLFVLWILGIVNASRIQRITNDSVLLIVFSTVQLLMAGLIMAIIERKKYKNQNFLVLKNNPMQDSNTNLNH